MWTLEIILASVILVDTTLWVIEFELFIIFKGKKGDK
jgi:hypothetical protein